MADLTDTERRIILGIRRAADALEAQAAAWRRRPESRPFGREAGRVLLAVAEVSTIGVRVELPHWLDNDGPGTRKAGQRALERLAAAGLVERHACRGERYTHAKLTTAGADLATRLLRARR